MATPLPEVVRLNSLLRTARTQEEFLQQIEAFLNEGRRGPNIEVSRLMEPESWDEKVEELSRIIARVRAGGSHSTASNAGWAA